MWGFVAKKTPKEKVLQTLECHKFVVSEVQFINKHLIKKLSNLNRGQQWLLYGRIINLMFSNFYKLSFENSEALLQNSNGDKGNEGVLDTEVQT